MNQTVKKPKIIRIIKTDYLCSLSFWGIVISTGFALYEKLYNNDNMLAITFSILAVFCFLMLIIRISSINKIFTHGFITTANVLGINPVRGKHQIYFSYSHDNEEYEKMNVVEVNEETKNIKEGDSIDICVYTKNPRKALIYSIYTA